MTLLTILFLAGIGLTVSFVQIIIENERSSIRKMIEELQKKNEII